ncbi:MAG: hypothetical protein R3D71_05315 [Rickettsiales bacterium]
MKYLLLFIISVIVCKPSFASNDSESPRSYLTGEQLAYYNKIFNYVMDYVGVDKSHKWNSSLASGEIYVGKPYISKSKSICRNFSEKFELNSKNISKNYKAIACQRNNGSWCRLSLKSEALTCALEKPNGELDLIMRDVGDFMADHKDTIDWLR